MKNVNIRHLVNIASDAYSCRMMQMMLIVEWQQMTALWSKQGLGALERAKRICELVTTWWNERKKMQAKKGNNLQCCKGS